MNLHLAEIATQIAPGAHAALLVDQAGWHLSGRLVMPPNITLIPLPAKCPELNPQENVWQFLRDNWLSNRIFKSFDDRRRPLLRGLEQARRSTLADHVHRPSQLGPWVLINEFCIRWRMTASFSHHHFPPAVIRHAVRLSVRFTLSYRDVQDLLAERGLDVSYEAVGQPRWKFAHRKTTGCVDAQVTAASAFWLATLTQVSSASLREVVK